jgi:hypothetical protein
MHLPRFSAALALILATSAFATRARADIAPLPPPAALPPLAAPLPPPNLAATTALPPPNLAATTASPEAAAQPPSTTSSVHLTYDATHVDRPAAGPVSRSPDDATVLHGFRLGYGYVMNYDEKVPAFQGQSLKEKLGLRAPSHFLLGYEIVYRVVGHSWLNVLLMGNAMIAGLEQSKVLPSANLLIGFELKNSFQLGVGANVSPLAGSEAHTIIAAGWTPRVGTIYTPLHVFFMPDVDGVHHMGVTTGVTF